MTDIIQQPSSPAVDFGGIAQLIGEITKVVDRANQTNIDSIAATAAAQAKIAEVLAKHRESMYALRMQNQVLYLEHAFQILQQIKDDEAIGAVPTYCPVLKDKVTTIMQGDKNLVGLICPRFKATNPVGEQCHLPEDDYQGGSRIMKGIHRKVFKTHGPCQFEKLMKAQKDRYQHLLEQVLHQRATDLADPAPTALPYHGNES